MKPFFALIIALFLINANAQTNYGLKFTSGQVIKYKETISVNNVTTLKGQRQTLRQAGSRTITMKVTFAKPTGTSLTVSYSNISATGVAIELPAEFPKEKKKELEKALTDGMKASLSSANRTQTTNYLGVTTFKLFAGEGKSFSIENGSFMGLVLPKTAPTPNSTWKAKVSQPDPSGKPINFTYKYVGEVVSSAETAYKITFSATENQSETQQGTKLSATLALNGTILLGKSSGMIVSGNVTTVVTTTITAKEGTQKRAVTTTQTFSKI